MADIPNALLASAISIQVTADLATRLPLLEKHLQTPPTRLTLFFIRTDEPQAKADEDAVQAALQEVVDGNERLQLYVVKPSTLEHNLRGLTSVGAVSLRGWFLTTYSVRSTIRTTLLTAALACRQDVDQMVLTAKDFNTRVRKEG